MFRGFSIHEFRLIVALLAVLGAGWTAYHWAGAEPEAGPRLYGAAVHHPPGELVYEGGGGRGGVEPSRVAAGGRIDLNRATGEDLQLLPGIGPARAQAIIEHRDREGAFPNVESLQRIHGVGPATVERLRPYLEVGDLPEGMPRASGPALSAGTPPRPVHVNRADSDELQRLPGVGPAIAARILEERRRGGPFRSVEEMQRVPGIGPRFVERNAHLLRMD